MYCYKLSAWQLQGARLVLSCVWICLLLDLQLSLVWSIPALCSVSLRFSIILTKIKQLLKIMNKFTVVSFLKIALSILHLNNQAVEG